MFFLILCFVSLDQSYMLCYFIAVILEVYEFRFMIWVMRYTRCKHDDTRIDADTIKRIFLQRNYTLKCMSLQYIRFYFLRGFTYTYHGTLWDDCNPFTALNQCVHHLTNKIDFELVIILRTLRHRIRWVYHTDSRHNLTLNL